MNKLQDNYANWVFPNEATIKADFDEYKLKEDKKWKHRAQDMGFRFPIFDTIESFETALSEATIVEITAEQDSVISNRSHCRSLEDLKRLVGNYHHPRDVNRIVNGYETNALMPMPIILKGSKGMWIMTGNTRLDTAFILGVTPKILIVDASA